ncbi:Cytochrome P450 3A8 [Nymphon striatum]|nr:Cytochrome P450 3A8 [Nymphon striatum]
MCLKDPGSNLIRTPPLFHRLRCVFSYSNIKSRKCFVNFKVLSTCNSSCIENLVSGCYYGGHSECKRSFGYWARQNVPGPRPWPFLGNIPLFMTKNIPFHEIDLSLWKKYGRTFGMYEPSFNVLMISDPEDIKKVYVKDFEVFADRRPIYSRKSDTFTQNFMFSATFHKWNAIRNVVSPTFSGSKLRLMASNVVQCSEELADCLYEIAKTENKFDAKKIFGSFSLDVIAITAFRIKLTSLKDPENEFIKNARKVFSPEATYVRVLQAFFPRLGQLLGLQLVEPSICNFFANVIRKVMVLRKGEDRPENDFLGLLKESMEEGAFDNPKKSEIPNSNDTSNKNCDKNSSKLMSEEMVLAQCILFFAAGYDTTSTTLSMSAYNLAVHPECQDKLIEEVDKAVQKHGNLTYEVVSEMPYLTAVIKETLRMFAPPVRHERVALQDYYLRDIFIKKGTLVCIPVHTVHHDPDIWPNPNAFDPKRFLGNQDDINPFTYVPFGVGRRSCVAIRFAMMELKVALATVLTKVKFCKVPSTSVPPIFMLRAAVVQPQNVIVGVETR